MLPDKQIKQIRDELDTCKRPLFFFDDDADGLSSFLLLYRYVREGKGIVVKSTPNIDDKFLRKVEEYQPDKIFVLDIAKIEQSFIDSVNLPIIWIDHHGPYERTGNIKYFNPRLIKKDWFLPVTRICYDVVKQDMWIAMVGCVGDYYFPDFYSDFYKKYKDLAVKTKNVEDLYFNSKIGELVNLFSFVLKGSASDALKYVKVLSRIKTPYEIFNEETSKGKFVFKKYNQIKTGYDDLLKTALEQKPENGFLIFLYPHVRMSFTSEVSNELLYRFPKEIILVGRQKNGEIKASLRSKKKNIAEALEYSINGLEAYGGGHENACGLNIKKEDFPEFLKRMREFLKIKC